MNEDEDRCYRCICEQCGKNCRDGFRYMCNSVINPNPDSFINSPNFSDYTPQPQYQTYSCELCGNDARYGHYCTPQVPNLEPCYNQNYDEFPQTDFTKSSTFPVIHQPPQEMSIQYMEDLKQQYLDEMKTLIDGKDYHNGNIDIEIKINELKGNFNEMSTEIRKRKKSNQSRWLILVLILRDIPLMLLRHEDDRVNYSNHT
ncbi:hypothetical protein Tco_0603097 [Tanacetum coccineum]